MIYYSIPSLSIFQRGIEGKDEDFASIEGKSPLFVKNRGIEGFQPQVTLEALPTYVGDYS